MYINPSISKIVQMMQVRRILYKYMKRTIYFDVWREIQVIGSTEG